MIGRTVVPALDQTLALRRAELLGFDLRAAVLLLPWIAAGLADAAVSLAEPEEDLSPL
ncbi:hypothetical protein [Pelagibius sp.]|uniref:hypothetical protein n=1 Tax=Pelagibius sp. TaxID=1931238 RepID=UPI0026280E4C|nr:hypothetical protein [Pelagibius sp.]